MNPCGSSSGSAISVAANMAAVSLGTETDGSILCPSSSNAIVGIKPTLGLTSRGGVIPITPQQDTVGPMYRTVSDAVAVLEVIVGFDPYDASATKKASKYIPRGGYQQFLKPDGLKGKRLGFFNCLFRSTQALDTLRKQGAILVDSLKMPPAMYDDYYCSERDAMLAEFKISLNTYLKDLVSSPLRSLADVIAFNNKHKAVEKIVEYDQYIFLDAQKTNGIDSNIKAAIKNLRRIDRHGFVKLMKMNKLDALVFPSGLVSSSIFAIGGHPVITVPESYDSNGVPSGLCFGGVRGSELKLIEIGYGFEQATKARRPPPPLVLP